MSIRPLTVLPTYLAYFEVYVKVTENDYHAADAAEKVQRYLYQAFNVEGEPVLVDLTGDDSHYAVVVRCVQHWSTGLGELQRAVQDQQARLSSGLYASSEVTYYAPTGV